LLVTSTTGIDLVAASPPMARVAAKPSIWSMLTSMRMTSGIWAFDISTACWPLVAVIVV